MSKKFIYGTVAVFVVWEILDFLMDGMLLKNQMMETANLWRPDINVWLLAVVCLIASAAFVYIYAAFVGNKSTATALRYGLVYGIGVGVGFAYGTYAVMDIPYSMALTWFLGTIVETVVAGYVVGVIVTPETKGAAAG